MKPKNATPWYGCPIRFSLGIWGDKWTLLIVRDLMFKGKHYFSEFSDPEEKLATNILADRLKKLEENGIVEKSVDEEKRSKYFYQLTEKGKDLLSVMLEIIDWSEKYDERTEVPEDFITPLRQNRKKFEKKLREKL